MKKGILLRCADKRHCDKVGTAISAAAGGDYNFYELAAPGGAGVLAALRTSCVGETMKGFIRTLMGASGSKEIFLAIHGTSHADHHGCGGYIHGGFEDKYSDPEESKKFSIDQLKEAEKFVKEFAPDAEVRLFYVTFDENGENVVEEVK